MCKFLVGAKPTTLVEPDFFFLLSKKVQRKAISAQPNMVPYVV